MRKGSERIYDNYRDEDIPKKIKLTIVENLTVHIKYPSKTLNSFLAKSDCERILNEGERLTMILAPKTTFEMTFRINKTYYL